MKDFLSKIGKGCDLRGYRGKTRTCVWCGKALPPRRIRWCSDDCPKVYLYNHTWTDARAEAVRIAGGRCRKCQTVAARPEVNHIVPRAGKGYGPGCHHHQSNLEVLCHRHHVLVTNAQARKRRRVAAKNRGLTAAKR